MSINVCDQGHITISPPLSQDGCSKCGGRFYAGQHITAIVEEQERLSKELDEQISHKTWLMVEIATKLHCDPDIQSILHAIDSLMDYAGCSRKEGENVESNPLDGRSPDRQQKGS